MKVDIRILNLSYWLALLTILFFPGKVLTEGAHRIEYGFPFRFFIQYHHELNGNRWFLQGVSIQLLLYFLDVAIVYGMLLGIKQVYKKLMSR